MKRISTWTSRRSFLSLGLLLIVSTLVAATWSRSDWAGHQAAQHPNKATSQLDAATTARLHDAYGQLPLSFEANVGQIDPQIDFVSRGSGYTLFITPGEAVLSLRQTCNLV
jgi:hypothetical protein